LTVFLQWCEQEYVTLKQMNNRNVHVFLEWLKTQHKPHRSDKTEISTYTLVDYLRSIYVDAALVFA